MTSRRRNALMLGCIAACNLTAVSLAQQTRAPATVVTAPAAVAAPAATIVAAPVQTPTAVPLRTPIQVAIPTAPNDWQPVLTGLHTGKYGPVLPALQGFVDLHTHPMSYLGFGGKLIYGAPDVMAMLPPTQVPPLPFAKCNTDPIAISKFDALGYENQEYGQPGPSNVCGDPQRGLFLHILASQLHAADYTDFTWPKSGPQSQNPGGPQGPDFVTWPAWNDVLRQKMWVDWIRRAHKGGLNVMVALAVNNKLLGDVTQGGYPPPFPGQSAHALPPGWGGQPSLETDDLSSANLQIDQIKAFVARHPDFMQLATSSAQLYDAVSHGKLAVIVGVEIDNIGDLVGNNVPGLAINQRIDDLFNRGVRYIFPVHLVDNPIGRTAAYTDLFNVANVYEEGGVPLALVCKQGISYVYQQNNAVSILGLARLGTSSPSIPAPTPCPSGWGNVNGGGGLTAGGTMAIQHMMDLGMLIDVDHMSEQTVNDTIAIAQRNMPIMYPLMSGHNNVRNMPANPAANTERQLTAAQYLALRKLHGMVGIGSAQANAGQWLQLYLAAQTAMGLPSNAPMGAFGTDADGMEFMMPPRPGSTLNFLPALGPAMDGTQIWNYKDVGVAHYGLLPEFLADAASLQGGATAPVMASMQGGAQYLYETWFLAEHARPH